MRDYWYIFIYNTCLSVKHITTTHNNCKSAADDTRAALAGHAKSGVNRSVADRLTYSLMLLAHGKQGMASMMYRLYRPRSWSVNFDQVSFGQSKQDFADTCIRAYLPISTFMDPQYVSYNKSRHAEMISSDIEMR